MVTVTVLSMKKKKQKAVTESKLDPDLKSMIHQHSLFFDKLIELIPAKFYLPNDDKEKPWFQGLSKAKKAIAKKKSRENIKAVRRARLDPEKSSTTTLDLLKQILEKEKSNESDDEKIDIKPMMSGLEGNNQSVTYEGLRQKLRLLIEESRASRNCGGPDKARKDEKHKRGIQQKKRKIDSVSEEKKPTTSSSADKVEKDISEASRELAFSHVKLDSDEEHGKKKKRKLSKYRELERAKKLEEAKKDPEKGEIISKKISWKTAKSRAEGIKVHDDPTLLKKSLKKEKKQKQKNDLKWKERMQARDKMKSERQQKRSENISQKIQDKKMRRIAKREKKLLRPGYEGSAQGASV